MYSLNEMSDALYGVPFINLPPFQQKAAATLFAGQAATEALAALRNIDCPLCEHKLGEHVSPEGCERERGDISVAEAGMMAQGPCGCTCEDLPDLQIALAVLRKVAA